MYTVRAKLRDSNKANRPLGIFLEPEMALQDDQGERYNADGPGKADIKALGPAPNPRHYLVKYPRRGATHRQPPVRACPEYQAEAWRPSRAAS